MNATDIGSESELEKLADLIAERVAAKLSAKVNSVDDPIVDRHALANRLGLSIATIDRRIREGSIPSFVSGRRRMFRLRDVVEAMSKNLTNTIAASE